MAIALVEGAFEDEGNSASVTLRGGFNVSISGTFSATVVLQRSFDGGSSWLTVATFTAPAEMVGEEPEDGTLYRASCTAYTSGAVAYRLSR